MKKHVDVLVLGGGSAGLVCALGAKTFGCTVALVEAEKLGGDCLNYGCVPSKTLIKTAKIANKIDNAQVYGLENATVNFKKIVEHIKEVQATIGVHDSRDRLEKEGILVFFGQPKFINKREVEVDDVTIKARKIVIATGSSPKIPEVLGLEKVKYITNRGVFTLKKKPEHLVILGGGPIGIEMAQAFSRLGSKVTIIQRNEHILPREDKEVSQALNDYLETEGVTILTGTNILNAEQKAGKKIVEIERNGKKAVIKGDELLVATGRTPNIEGLDLEKAGVRFSEKGIKVNRKLQTKNKRIYAAGDVVNGPKFTHVAEYHARAIVRNMLFPGSTKVHYHVLPWVTFTDPELAHVGMTEEEAKIRKIKHKTLKVHMKDVDRAQTESKTEGLAKVIVTKKGKILGASILAPHGGEILQEFVLAMQTGVKIQQISQTIHPYPTLAQINRKLADQFYAEKLKKSRMLRLLVRFWK